MTPAAAQRAATRGRQRAVAGRLASLFDEHASMVLGLCRLLLRDHHEAEDAAQQTFVSAYRSLLRGNEPRDAAPWLAAIARNECRARIRKRMRAPLALENELEEQLADPTDIAEESERRAELAALTAAIAELPSRQREAVALRDFLGLSYEEVASTLSVSVPVVESLLFRARRRLRDTVRTVPRYAAGLVAIPFAVRAAVSRELPELDTQGAAGAAGITGAAAAGVLAKIVSLPFAGKAATAVTVVAVATAGPQLPKILDREQPPSRSAAALHDSPGPPPASTGDAPSKPPFEAVAVAEQPQAAAPDSSAAVEPVAPSGDPARGGDEAEEPASTGEAPVESVEPPREILSAGPTSPERPPPLADSPPPPAAEPVIEAPAPDPALPIIGPPHAAPDDGTPWAPLPPGEEPAEPGPEEPEAPGDPGAPCTPAPDEETEPATPPVDLPGNDGLEGCPAPDEEDPDAQPEAPETTEEPVETPGDTAEPSDPAEPSGP
jgi:RNA polymerase sigma-70 factor (ECF subfamily)